MIAATMYPFCNGAAGACAPLAHSTNV